MTDWFVYRCDDCRSTVYVRADVAVVNPHADHATRLLGLASESEFVRALRDTR